MKHGPTLTLTKIDAARRQLETAIRLWFYSGDPVSIHTLAAAAHQILHDLGKSKGAGTIIRGMDYVRPEFRREVAKAVAQEENFFKHADRDPNATLDFNPFVTQLFLFDAVHSYQALTDEQLPTMGALKVWIFIHYPESLKEEARGEWKKKIESFRFDVRKMPKSQFFEICMQSSIREGSGS